jgi:hypothetical protein
MKSRIFTAFFLVFPLFGFTQDEGEIIEESSEGSSFYYGINIGGVLANKYTASYYNGYNGTDAFNLVDLISIQQVYDQIYNKIGRDFYLGEVPLDRMRYKTGILAGLHLGWYTDEDVSFFINADFVRLQLADVFTLESEDPANPSGDPKIYTELILGEENRLHFDLGMHIDFGVSTQLKGYFEMYGSLNSVRPVNNQVYIEGLSYNLLQPPSVYSKTDLGGIGWGIGAGTGIRYRFNKHYSFDLGGALAFQRINLYLVERLKLNPVLYLRILRN